MKRVKILHIIITILLSLFYVVVTAQNEISNIKSDDLLKLRNLQYEQAKHVIRMQELKSEFDKLNNEQQIIVVEIDSWIKEQAKLQNVDLTKNRFDLDKLKFVEIKQNE